MSYFKKHVEHDTQQLVKISGMSVASLIELIRGKLVGKSAGAHQVRGGRSPSGPHGCSSERDMLTSDTSFGCQAFKQFEVSDQGGIRVEDFLNFLKQYCNVGAAASIGPRL